MPVDEREFWFGDAADPAAATGSPLTVLIGGSYYLDRDPMHPLLETLPPVIVLPRSRRDGSIDAVVELLGAEHDREGAGATAAIPALLDLLLAYVIRAVFEDGESGSGGSAVLRDRAVTRALSNMQRHPDVSWTVESLARASSLSRAAFARRFSRLVGQAPLRYLTRCRMNLARQLLTESDLPITDIARRVGYGSEFALGKAFARENGIAPGSYRRSRGGRQSAPTARR